MLAVAPQILVVLVGVPGSGKSTFSSQLLERAPPRWTRISQDVLGTRKRCLGAARRALEDGSNVRPAASRHSPSCTGKLVV